MKYLKERNTNKKERTGEERGEEEMRRGGEGHCVGGRECRSGGQGRRKTWIIERNLMGGAEVVCQSCVFSRRVCACVCAWFSLPSQLGHSDMHSCCSTS